MSKNFQSDITANTGGRAKECGRTRGKFRIRNSETHVRESFCRGWSGVSDLTVESIVANRREQERSEFAEGKATTLLRKFAGYPVSTDRVKLRAKVWTQKVVSSVVVSVVDFFKRSEGSIISNQV